jgi:hypothetical protein
MKIARLQNVEDGCDTRSRWNEPVSGREFTCRRPAPSRRTISTVTVVPTTICATMLPMRANLGAVLLLVGIAIAQSPAAKKDWELLRSISNPSGGTIDLVVIPAAKQRNRDYYNNVAEAICGQRATCMVNFWTDPKHVPQSGWIPVPDLAVMTASYERSPKYEKPVLSLSCWLYPNKAAGELDKCEYLPGAKRPPNN